MYYVLIPPLLTALICSTESAGERELKALLSSTRLCLLHQGDPHRVCASTGANNNRNNIISTGARSQLQDGSCACPTWHKQPRDEHRAVQGELQVQLCCSHNASTPQQQQPLSVLRDQEALAAQEQQQLRAELIPYLLWGVLPLSPPDSAAVYDSVPSSVKN